MENQETMSTMPTKEQVDQQPNTPVVKKRMEEQDVAKGIAIFMVMALHILVIQSEFYQVVAVFSGFIMGLFFFLSGFNYKPGRTYKENVIKRIKQMVIPFVIYISIVSFISGLYLILTNQATFLQILETFCYDMLGSQFSTQIGLTTACILFHRNIMIGWFIIMLITASFIFYAVVDLCLKNMYSFISINILLLSITILLGYLNFSLPFYLREATTIASIMLFGALFKKYKVFQSTNKMWIIINSIIAYGLYIGMALIFRGGGFIMGGKLLNSFGPLEGLITLVYAIFGSYAFLNFCKLLTKVKWLKFVLTYLGNYSVYYLLLHQLVKFFLQEMFNYHPTAMMMSSEVTEGMSFLILFLTIVVITLYIILLNFIKKKIKENKENKAKLGALENESK